MGTINDSRVPAIEVDRAGQALRRLRPPSTGSPSTSSRARSSASSGPTAPASRRRSRCCARSPSRRPVRRRSPATTSSPSALDVRRNIGLVFQDPTLDVYLTAEQNLRFHAELYGMPKAMTAGADARGARDGRAVGAARRQGADVLRRHAAPAGDRPRADALAAGAVPRRADRRPRPADAGEHLDVHRRAARDARTSRSSSPRTTWTRPRTATASPSWTPARSSCSTRPTALKASVGTDRVQISTDDDEAAIDALRERFGIAAEMHDGAVTFGVPDGRAVRAPAVRRARRADQVGRRGPAVARRRVHVLHRPHDPRRRGDAASTTCAASSNAE